jgi:aspartyl-tRNA synthetase
MVSGFDKYYQIVKCFRDEDLRADRQPEFTQIDIEMSFVEQYDVIKLIDKFIKEIFSEIKNITINEIPQMTYQKAVNTYGTDRPDLRFDLKLHDLSEIFKNSEFKIFQDALNATNKRDEKGSIKAIVLNTDISNKKLKKYEQVVKEFKAKGLIILRYQENNLQGSILKFFTNKEKEELKEKLQLKENDVVFIVSDPDIDIVNTSLGNLRNKLGKDFNLYEPIDNYSILWVTDFPLFSWDEDNQRWTSEHHPFTMPNPNDIKYLDTNPGKVKSWAYDLVINGLEAGGGSIRIHDPSLQRKIFSTLKISKEEQQEKFGFLLESFKYGVPPHGGIAFGFDRLVALFCNTNDIREVIAFPKNKNAQNPMDQSPNFVDKEQLYELHIQTKD